MMQDLAHEEIDKMLEEIEKRLAAEYAAAAKDIAAKIEDYQRRLEKKRKTKLQAVKAKLISEREYKQWLTGQLIVGERWKALADEIAVDMQNVNERARAIVYGYQIAGYAENFNYATYLIETGAGVDTSFILYDADTVARLIREDPKILPAPGPRVLGNVARNNAILWNEQQLTSIAFQAIVQGENIAKIADRFEKLGPTWFEDEIKMTSKEIAKDLSRKNRGAAIRNARTMMTAAQNAGRVDAAKRAESLGIKSTEVWAATLDMRTRHEHRVLDGQRRKVGEPFEVDGYKLRYPGDPDAPGYLVYNCRCRLIPQVSGFEYDIRRNSDFSKLDAEGLSYYDWKKSRVEKPNPITLPEEKANAIKWKYISEYKSLAKRSQRR